MRREIKSEGRVAMHTAPQMPAVEPDIAFHVDAFEQHFDAPLRRHPLHPKVPAVPALAPDREAGGGAPGALLVERPDPFGTLLRRQVFDAPVVRQIQSSPGTVIEARCFEAFAGALEELPAEVERLVATQSHRSMLPRPGSA